MIRDDNDALSMSSRQESRHVRLVPRWKNQTIISKGGEQQQQQQQQQQVFDFQTSVTTLERRIVSSPNNNNNDDEVVTSKRQRVDVHAQVHFGSKDYFDYFNNAAEFQTNNVNNNNNNNNNNENAYHVIHYELLVDESLLLCCTNNHNHNNNNSTTGLRYMPRHRKGQLMASNHDQQMAQQYGLCCQVDIVDCTKPNWIHSDLTRQELLAAISNHNNKPITTFSPSSLEQQQQQQQQQPLWALASTAPTWPGVEAAVALLRPLTPSVSLSSSSSSSVVARRRLFTNLFLPGTTLTAWLRAMFWFTLPCPELNVLLLDWSSLWPPPSGTLSPIALPVLECLLRGKIQSARQLILAQMLVSQSSSSSSQQQQQQQYQSYNNNYDSQDEPLLIGRRNDQAWKAITTSLDHDVTSVAVLYGSSHIPDLIRRFMQIGFVPVQTRWRTAWSVEIPSLETTSNDDRILVNYNNNNNNNINNQGSIMQTLDVTAAAAALSPTASVVVALVILLPFYFFIGGYDWISTLRQVASAAEQTNVADAGIEIVLYLLRHALLYLGLAKFVVAWDHPMLNNNNNNNNDNNSNNNNNLGTTTMFDDDKEE